MSDIPADAARPKSTIWLSGKTQQEFALIWINNSPLQF
jgi:hypothetical protein